MKNKILVGILVGIFVTVCSTVSYGVGVSRTYAVVKKELDILIKNLEKDIQKNSQEEILEQDIED